MKMLGSELIFISRIKRDGSGVEYCSGLDMSGLDNTLFEINCLSGTQKTFIATEFNAYVVKKKQV
jgi:hypothetical protein